MPLDLTAPAVALALFTAAVAVTIALVYAQTSNGFIAAAADDVTSVAVADSDPISADLHPQPPQWPESGELTSLRKPPRARGLA